MSVAFSFALFGVGVALVIWATQRLLEGLVGLAWLLRVSAFAVAAILSGFEAENVAVGLAAAPRRWPWGRSLAGPSSWYASPWVSGRCSTRCG